MEDGFQAWIKDGIEARSYLKRLRRLVLIFNIGVIAWFVSIMAIQTKGG